jgi:8-oxo-dGTP diphosphatase
MSLPDLTTARLALRGLQPGDATAMFRLVNDYSVAGNLARVPFPYREAMARDWIGSTHDQAARGEGFHLAITMGDQLIGCIGLTTNRANPGEAELGYWLGRKFWGQGFAREATRALLEWGFGTLGLDRVVASALTDNLGSQAVLRACGFAQTGQAMQEFMSRNRIMDVLTFEMAKPREMAPARALPMLLVVACAIVDGDGRVLLAQRPPGKALAGMWEFPGGKLNPGETPEAALIRELKEELDIDVTAACLAPLSFASHAYESFHLLMPLFVCRRWRGTMRAVEGQALAWVRPNRMAEYPMPPADRPLVAMLQEML